MSARTSNEARAARLGSMRSALQPVMRGNCCVRGRSQAGLSNGHSTLPYSLTRPTPLPGVPFNLPVVCCIGEFSVQSFFHLLRRKLSHHLSPTGRCLLLSDRLHTLSSSTSPLHSVTCCSRLVLPSQHPLFVAHRYGSSIDTPPTLALSAQSN
jgi:hypothetical protein